MASSNASKMISVLLRPTMWPLTTLRSEPHAADPARCMRRRTPSYFQNADTALKIRYWRAKNCDCRNNV